jgi:pimeloyl-ACP methyl ester carboxylesterase
MTPKIYPMKTITLLVHAAIVGAALTPTCWSQPVPSDAWRDTSSHRALQVSVNGLRIHYLDWGGSGDPIVFLHGSGDSPHYFDRIAPIFATRHRVVAPARRGHGQSEIPTEPFTVDDLVEDLRQFLDALKLESVTLIGFSFGGNEITRFAELYPQRVAQLIYLDATLERSRPEQNAVFESLIDSGSPASADVASLDAFRSFVRHAWYPGVQWTETMEAVFRDFSAIAANGTVSTPSDRVSPSMAAVRKGYRRNYQALKCPVLIILAEYYERAPAGAASATVARLQQWHSEQYSPYQDAVVEQLKREIPLVQIVKLRGVSHNALPVVAHDKLVSEIEQFLGSSLPRGNDRAAPIKR